MTFAQHGPDDGIVTELGTQPSKRFIRGAQIAARARSKHRELFARRGHIIGPHARRMDRRDRRHAGQPKMNEPSERATVQRRRCGLDAIRAQLRVADRAAERELDVQRHQRATPRGEPIEQAIDRALQDERETLDITEIIVEHDVLVRRLRWRDGHERIPALSGRELIHAMCIAPEPLEDPAPWQAHHLSDGGHPKACERIPQFWIDLEPCERNGTGGRTLLGITGQHRDTGLHRTRDRVRREPREPDDDGAPQLALGDRALDREAPRSAGGAHSVDEDPLESGAVEPERAWLVVRFHARRELVQGGAELGNRDFDHLWLHDARTQPAMQPEGMRIALTWQDTDSARPFARPQHAALRTILIDHDDGLRSQVGLVPPDELEWKGREVEAGDLHEASGDHDSWSNVQLTDKPCQYRKLHPDPIATMPPMKDKVIVITGASSGIGASLAELAARRGARGIVVAARRADELAKQAEKLGPTALAVVTDVTRRAEVDRLRDQALARFGHIDVWINNAGRGISRLVSELTDADIDDMMTVNLKSVLYGIQAVLPHFRERKRGHIITVSSGLARFPFAPFRSAYSASKAAVNLLMGSLRMELKTAFPEIHTTTVMPGVVSTEFGANALHGGPDSRALPGTQPVEEVAEVIADVVDHPRAEVYTRAQMLQLAARYFGAEDVAAIESQPPFR